MTSSTPAKSRPPVPLTRWQLAAMALDVARLRKLWPLGPPVVALAMLVAAPALHLVWRLFDLPAVVPAFAAAVAAVFAGVATFDRRQGWPRALAGLGFSTVIVWSWVVWQWGPSAALLSGLGWGLVLGWPLWLWHRWWRDRERFVQVAENRWVKRAGAPDPGLDRLAGIVRRLRKRRRRNRNATEHREQRAARQRTAKADGRRATLAALAEQAEAVGAAELARRMGANRETVRRHLVAAAAEGLVEAHGTGNRVRYTAGNSTTPSRARARIDVPGPDRQEGEGSGSRSAA
jgi:DNA-binding transcriptional ArsR family regulator